MSWGGEPGIQLVWGKLETAAASQQAAFKLLKSSAQAPVIQQLDDRGTAPWLVQFKAPIRPEWTMALEAEGAVISGYVPEQALLLLASPQAIVRIGNWAEVVWAGEFLPAYKQAAWPSPAPGAAGIPEQACVVALFQAGDQVRIARRFGEMGVFVPRADARGDSDVLRVRLTPAQVEEVSNWGEVEWIEPVVRPQLWSEAPAAAAEPAVPAPAAEVQPAGRGQAIAICDTGLDAAHPDFENRAVGFSWTADGRWTDARGHGTLAAGAAAGDGAASTGRYAGVARAAHLVVQAMGADLSGLPADLGSVLQQAWDAGARIQLIGWGRADTGAYGVDARALDRFTWRHPEMLVVTAAGNAATDLVPADGVVDAGSVGSPATAKNGLAVGAAEGPGPTPRVWRDAWPEDFAVEPIALDPVAHADGPRGLAAFSGRGPCRDGRIKPDLVAPGTQLVSTRSRIATDTAWGAAGHADYLQAGGTSLAAAQAAGTAALIRQWLAEKRGMPAPSAALVKALLIAGARSLAPGQYGNGAKREIPAQRPNNAEGFGLLETAGSWLDGAVEVYDEIGLATGQIREYSLDCKPEDGRCILVLAYADYAAALPAGRQLVNDLDLTVQSPAGIRRHANGENEPDSLNNVEWIEFDASQKGVWQAQVAAREVPMGGRQPYALVIRRIRPAAVAAAQEQP